MSHSTLITDYLGYGAIASRPASPNLPTGCTGFYLATDTGEAALWNGASWVDIAGTQTITLGAGITQTGSIFGTGTLTPNYRGGTLTSFGTGLTLSAGVLTPNFQAGVLSSFGTGLTLTTGVLTPNFQAGVLSSFGTGLTLTTGVLTPNWQAGVASTVGSNLSLIGGTLSFQSSPTITSTGTATPIVMSSGSFTVPNIAQVVAAITANSGGVRAMVVAYGGTPQFTGARAQGTLASPTAVAAGGSLFSINGFGYDGTAWSSGTQGTFAITAINNWTTADHSTMMTWSNTRASSTTQVEDMRLTGGVLLIGTTVAAGSELLRIAGITNTASLQVNGGSITSAFSPRFSWTSGTIDVIDTQGTLTLSGTTTGTVTPASNSSFLVNVGTAAGTIAIASGVYNGQKLRLEILQGATAHTVGFDSSVAFGTDITSFTATASANARDYAQLVWNGTKWNFVAVSHGYT